MDNRLKRVQLPLYALLFFVLLGVVGCGADTVAVPTPTAVLATPVPTPTSSPIAPTSTPIAATKTAVFTPIPTETPPQIDPLPSEELVVVNPDFPGMNVVAVGQQFVLQAPDADWTLIRYDTNRLMMLSGREAQPMADVYGWQFAGIAPGEATITIEKDTPVCTSDPCPPEALIRMDAPITVE